MKLELERGRVDITSFGASQNQYLPGLGADVYWLTCGVCVRGAPLQHWEEVKPPREPLEHVLTAAPLEAWRAWRIIRNDEAVFTRERIKEARATIDRGEDPFRGVVGARLAPLGLKAADTWTPTMTAVCNKHLLYSSRGFVEVPHLAPDGECDCGIWALPTEEEVLRVVLASYRGNVGTLWAWGRVQLWGQFYEHEKGFRAQYARPIEIWLSGKDLDVRDDLAGYYGCLMHCAGRNPVEAFDPYTGLLIGRGLTITLNGANYTNAVTGVTGGFLVPSSMMPFNQALDWAAMQGITNARFTKPLRAGRASTFLESSQRWSRFQQEGQMHASIKWEPGWFELEKPEPVTKSRYGLLGQFFLALAAVIYLGLAATYVQDGEASRAMLYGVLAVMFFVLFATNRWVLTYLHRLTA